LRSRQDANYTQQDAKEIIEHNSADENAALMKLAERLVQQQDAALANPAALRANIPAQGRLLTFKRAVLVDPNAELRLNVSAITQPPFRLSAALILAVAALVMGVLLQVKRVVGRPEAAGANS